MPANELDNPFWASLPSRHQALAQASEGVARYPADYAPFLGVASADVAVSKVLPLGIAPRTPEGGLRQSDDPLAQMV